MQTQIILRKVAGASAHFAELAQPAGLDGYAGPDRGSIAIGADQLEKYPMIAVAQGIHQQRRWFAEVQNHDVDISAVENIAKSRAPPRPRRCGSKTRLPGDFVEGSVAVIAIQLYGLAIRR